MASDYNAGASPVPFRGHLRARYNLRHGRHRRAAPPPSTAASACTERGTTLRPEALGGLSTFLTMSYILFVNPAILSAAKVPVAGGGGRDGARRGDATAAMGLFANLPFALAPGLGHQRRRRVRHRARARAPVAGRDGVHRARGLIALGARHRGLREAVVNAVPDSLKLSIGVGIGLFITLRRPAPGRHRRQRPGDRHRASAT
jgi:hypothetical protein